MNIFCTRSSALNQQHGKDKAIDLLTRLEPAYQHHEIVPNLPGQEHENNEAMEMYTSRNLRSSFADYS